MINFFYKYDAIFYCSHFVDETWIRSTIFELSSKNQHYKILLMVEGILSKNLIQIYKDKGVIVEYGNNIRKKNYRSNVLISASTSINRNDFHHKIKYFCHMPHSLISLHEGYPENAFDAFNILFACGEHHINEFKAIAKLRNKKQYKIFKSGYGKLDILISQYSDKNLDHNHVLIAPSWGKGNIIETYCAYSVITSLLDMNYHVTLRPHPALLLYQQEKLKPYFEISSPRFEIEKLSTSKAIFTADHLITDFSGVYFEYNLIKHRKTIFVDSSRKIFNSQHLEYTIKPFEITTRKQFGTIVSDNTKDILSAISSKDSLNKSIKHENIVYNLGQCGNVVSNQLMEIIESASYCISRW